MSTLRVISIGHITDPLVLGSNTPPFLCSSECVKNPERKPLVSTIFAITLSFNQSEYISEQCNCVSNYSPYQ